MKPDQKPKTTLHDIVTGGIEGGAGVVATDALIENLMHSARGDGIRTRLAKTGKSIVGNFRAGNRAGLLKKLAIGAGVGAAATGAIGAGVNALSPKRKEELSALTPRMIALEAALGKAAYFSDRDRNDAGQFVANETGGADPNSMAAAYGPGAIQNANSGATDPGYSHLAAEGAASMADGVAANFAAPAIKRGAVRLRGMLR